MKAFIILIISIFIPISSCIASENNSKYISQIEKETEEVLKKTNSAREIMIEWIQGYIEDSAAEKEILSIAEEVKNMPSKESDIQEMENRSEKGRRIIEKSLKETAEYVKNGDPYDSKKFTKFTEKQARDSYAFIKWQSDSIRLYISHVEDISDGVYLDYIKWKKTILRIEEKTRELALEAELCFIKASEGKNEKTIKDLERLIKKADSILQEIIDAECPESMSILKKSAIGIQEQMIIFLKEVTSMFKGDSEKSNFDNVMKSYKENTSIIKSEAEKFTEKL